jgi:hypothetical protein
VEFGIYVKFSRGILIDSHSPSLWSPSSVLHGQYLAGTFCGGCRLYRAGLDNVRLGVSICDSFGKDLESLDLIIFTLSTRLSL